MISVSISKYCTPQSFRNQGLPHLCFQLKSSSLPLALIGNLRAQQRLLTPCSPVKENLCILFFCLIDIRVSTLASPTFKAWLYSRKIYRGIFDCSSRLKQLLFISITVLYNLAHVYEDIGSRWKSRLIYHSFSVLLVLSTNFHFFLALCCLQKVHFGSDSLDKISKTIKEKVCASVLLLKKGNMMVTDKEGVCECNPVWRREPWW